MVPTQVAPGLPELLLWRSASVAGFFLLHYAALYKKHLARLVSAWQAGKLHVALDSQRFRCANYDQSLHDQQHCLLGSGGIGGIDAPGKRFLSVKAAGSCVAQSKK